MKPDSHKTKASREYQKKHGLLPVKQKPVHKNVQEQPVYRDVDSDAAGNEEQLAQETEFASIISGNAISGASDEHQFQLKSEQLADSMTSKSTISKLFQLDPEKLNDTFESLTEKEVKVMLSSLAELEISTSTMYPISMELCIAEELTENLPQVDSLSVEETVTSKKPVLRKDTTTKAASSKKETIDDFLDDLLG